MITKKINKPRQIRLLSTSFNALSLIIGIPLLILHGLSVIICNISDWYSNVTTNIYTKLRRYEYID